MGPHSRAWQAASGAFGVLRRHGRHALHPALAGAFVLVATFAALVPLFERVLVADDRSPGSRALLFLLAWAAYAALYLVVALSHVALVSGIAGRLDGRDPGVVAAATRALGRLRPIVTYTEIGRAHV